MSSRRAWIASIVGGATVVLLAELALAQPTPPSSASAGPLASAPPSSASASSSAAPVPLPTGAEVLVLHANNSGTGIDPKVSHLTQLTKPPLSIYNSYKLLNKINVPLAVNQTAKNALPDGSTLSLGLNGVAPNSQNRFKYATSITRANGQNLLSVEVSSMVNDYFFIVAQKYKDGPRDGTLVVGIKLTK
ncbi:MAG: hypothetical protein U0165_10915 [Polyangiaceae bacterium]